MNEIPPDINNKEILFAHQRTTCVHSILITNTIAKVMILFMRMKKSVAFHHKKSPTDKRQTFRQSASSLQL